MSLTEPELDTAAPDGRGTPDASAAGRGDGSPKTRIPRTVHYCWFGPAPISALGRRCIETWRDVMPDYALELWDESRLDLSRAYLAIAYRQRKFAFVADYVRLQALYAHGGLYFDTDIEVLKPFDALLGEALFMGLQTPDSVAAGVIGAVKGHPFLKLALDRLDAEARSGRLSLQPLPELITGLARTYKAIAPRLLPEECFYPYNPHSPDPLRRKPLQRHISERTFCIHHWEGSWLGDASLGMMLGLRLKDRLLRATPKRWRPTLAAPRGPEAGDARACDAQACDPQGRGGEA
jgi:mannosyltransferase OCH1-like enzyme